MNRSDPSTTAPRPRGRREEYAEATRRAIEEAARTLFCEKGFFTTKVEDIAAMARVAPATVYSVAGGKQGLLATIMDSWTTAPVVAATEEAIAELTDPAAAIALLASSARRMREDYGDIMRMMLATAPHDAGAADALATATDRYRGALQRIAERLAGRGAFREGIGADEATDVLWFYLGYAGLFTLHDDNGWTYDRAEEWLAARVADALLRHPAG